MYLKFNNSNMLTYPKAVSILFLMFLIPLPLLGQEIGLEYGATRAGYDDALETPTGFGIHADIPLIRDMSMPVVRQIELRLTASRHTENRTLRRSRCTGFIFPGTDCSPDTFDGDSDITRLGIGLVVGFESVIGGIKPEIYAMGISSSIDTEFIGRESGRNIGPVDPENPSPGLEFGTMLNYSVTPFFGLYGRFAIQNTTFGSCGVDAWFAFCEDRTLHQFSLGAVFRFSTLRE
jgi:hypothetical protein